MNTPSVRARRLALTRQLTQHTAKVTKCHPAQVADAIDFTSKFIAKTITADAYEGVSLPYFGKFVAKLDQVQLVDMIKAKPRSVTNEVI